MLNFDIFGIFSGTLVLILFCFLETRKTLLSSRGQAPFESSRKNWPREVLRKAIQVFNIGIRLKSFMGLSKVGLKYAQNIGISDIGLPIFC